MRLHGPCNTVRRCDARHGVLVRTSRFSPQLSLVSCDQSMRGTSRNRGKKIAQCVFAIAFVGVLRASCVDQSKATFRSFKLHRVTTKEHHVFVASHRRSGTHLLMNFLYNHFEGQRMIIRKLNHLPADESLGCACFNGMLNSGKLFT